MKYDEERERFYAGLPPRAARRFRRSNDAAHAYRDSKLDKLAAIEDQARSKLESKGKIGRAFGETRVDRKMARARRKMWRQGR